MKRIVCEGWILAAVLVGTPGCVAPSAGDESDESDEDVGELAQAIDGYLLSNVAPSVEIGDAVSVDFVAPPGHSQYDWVGLRRVGAPWYEYVSWQYASADSGTLSFPTDGLSAGESYEFQIYLNNGYESKDVSSSFVAQTPVPVYGLSNGPVLVSPGQAALVSWTAPANHSLYDWVGLFESGAAAQDFIDYYYLDVAGTTSGVASVIVPEDAVPGSTYELRLYLDDLFDLAASGPSFVVGAGVIVSSEPVAPGGVVSASWSGEPGHSPEDWVGLYEVGAPDSPPMAWRYVGSGDAGSVDIQIPSGAPVHSTCELRYFRNNSYEKLGESADFMIANTLSIAADSILPGQPIDASWTTPSAHSQTDWVGLYEVGAPDYAQQGWAFIAAPGATSGSTQLTLPQSATLGQAYELRYFLNQTYTLGSRSNSFIAGGPLYSVSGPGGPVSAGSSLQVAWASPTAHSAQDWIGLRVVGADAYAIASFAYVASPGVGNGNVDIVVPADAVPGSYELRYYLNNGYTSKAVSEPFDVQ